MSLSFWHLALLLRALVFPYQIRPHQICRHARLGIEVGHKCLHLIVLHGIRWGWSLSSLHRACPHLPLCLFCSLRAHVRGVFIVVCVSRLNLFILIGVRVLRRALRALLVPLRLWRGRLVDWSWRQAHLRLVLNLKERMLSQPLISMRATRFLQGVLPCRVKPRIYQ